MNLAFWYLVFGQSNGKVTALKWLLHIWTSVFYYLCTEKQPDWPFTQWPFLHCTYPSHMLHYLLGKNKLAIIMDSLYNFFLKTFFSYSCIFTLVNFYIKLNNSETLDRKVSHHEVSASSNIDCCCLSSKNQ